MLVFFFFSKEVQKDDNILRILVFLSNDFSPGVECSQMRSIQSVHLL